MANIKKIAKGRRDVFFVDPHDLKIKPDFNVRISYALDELKEQIKGAGGVKKPLEVYRENDEFFIKDGHRRWLSTMQLIDEGFEILAVPCMITDESQEDRTFGLIISNSGKPLSKTEEGIVFSRLINFGYNVSQIAVKIGKSVSYVNQALLLSKAPKKVKDLIGDGKIMESTVLEIMQSVDDYDKVCEIVIQSIADAENHGLKRSKISRVVKQKLGNPTVSVKKLTKELNSWTSENSIVLANDPIFKTITLTSNFFQGQISLNELITALYNNAP